MVFIAKRLETSLTVQLARVAGALSALTTSPRNVIIAKGQDVNMECSTDAAAGTTGINWRFDGSEVVEDCMSSDTSRFSVSSPTTNDCFITGHANTVSGNQGPYHCSDGSTVQAEAVAILIGMHISRCRALNWKGLLYQKAH